MIKLADQPPGSKATEFRCCCPNCRRVLMVKTHQSYKDVTCPRCFTKFTAQYRPPVARQQNSVPAAKVNPVRWLVALLALALVLIGAVVLVAYWYQRPQPPSPATVAEVQIPDDKNKVNPVTPKADYADYEEELTLEPVSDLIASPVLPSPGLPDLAALLPPVALDVPIVMPAIDLRPPKVEQKPQQEPQPAPEQPPTSIQPLGDLTWEDDLLTAFQKTLALTDSKSVTVAGIRCTDEQSMLGALRRLRADSVLGIQKPVVRQSLYLIGYPVIIDQGAFQIELEFISEPGYVLDHADKCLAQAKQVFGPEADSYFPLRLRRVELTLRENTESRTLDGNTKVKIALQTYEQLKTKYADKKHFTSKDEPWTTTWQDLFKHKLRVYGSPGGASLLYESDLSYFSDLNQKLRKLQDEIKEKEHTGRFAKSEDRSDKL